MTKAVAVVFMVTLAAFSIFWRSIDGFALAESRSPVTGPHR